ncbi:helix-turn-helix domain-containing protein [Rhizobium sp. L80/93]|uniref:helix-turn-helix domain-containing protein n=1 Tax=Rhizobium sp. E27B/91 TaxID=2819995 RepID=UPI001AD9C196|nr:helix-turn-helix domain-containing protein [Rhizobium sp. E27B/91]
MTKCLDHNLSLGVLADQAAMSLRSFSRRYQKCTGRTPAQSIETFRVKNARRLLEGGASVMRAATRCGFGTTGTMRRAFLRHVGVGPNAYRNRFHG